MSAEGFEPRLERSRSEECRGHSNDLKQLRPVGGGQPTVGRQKGVIGSHADIGFKSLSHHQNIIFLCTGTLKKLIWKITE